MGRRRQQKGEAPAAAPSRTFPIVGVGASAGGFEALSALLGEVPDDCGLAFVLVQHLDPTHDSHLSEALSRASRLPIAEIEDGMVVAPGHVYVMPAHADVGILGGTLSLLPRANAPGGAHLPIDAFFEALAADCGPRAIGVVLSGTGADGTRGLLAIKAEGGVTFAQDPATARFSGMPDAAIRAGAVDFSLPLPEIAVELDRLSRHPFVTTPRHEVAPGSDDEGELRRIYVLLRGACGVDFSEYKRPGFLRRLGRRLAVRRVATLSDYVRLLRDDRAEAQALFADLLIHVTSFFRDEETFERLKTAVFPSILHTRQPGETIRLWCAGCSTGEEAYSLLIALSEFLAEQGATEVPVQLFGTDVSEKAIEAARAGVYPDAAVRGLDPRRLDQAFTRLEGGGYRIKKNIRERCAFVQHDLASDPPFSRIDLVSCRNVLIYFDADLQKRVLSTFHFALSQPGFLLLGRAENVPDPGLFTSVDKEHKIFERRAVRSGLRLPPVRVGPRVTQAPTAPGVRVTAGPDAVRRAETLLLDRYAPPGVVVNERLEVLHFRGRTGPWLEPAPGDPQTDLLKMARHELLADLRVALAQARVEGVTVRRPGVRVELDGAPRTCDLVVMPVPGPSEAAERAFMVLFEEPGDVVPAVAETAGDAARPEPTAEARRASTLQGELDAARAHLQVVLEEHQRATEDRLTANEELLSRNEELQSLNEELETAKEELQSSNEELSTLNEELHTRNTELNEANGDLLNILGSVEVPIVIVDGQRRIRRFTPRARPILNLLPADVGRPIDDIKPALTVEHLDQKIADVIDTVAPYEEETQGRDGRWFRLQIRPYATVDKRIDGAVLSVVDIDALKRALTAAEWARDYAVATVQAVQTPLLLLNGELKVLSSNDAFVESFGVKRADAEGGTLSELLGGVFDAPGLHAALERVLGARERFQRLELERELPGRGPRSLSMTGRGLTTPSGEQLVLLAVEDVTERRQRQAEREELLRQTEAAQRSATAANQAKDVFLATLSHELRTPLTSLLLQAHILRRSAGDEARVKRAAEVIARSARAQAQLIEDLLDVSRITTGRLRVDRNVVDLAGVVRAAVETVAAGAEEKHVELAVELTEGLPPVSGDAGRLQQVVWNLLVNAVKFTPARGQVTVRLDAVDGQGRVCVSDDGAGIEPAFLPQVFSRFSQEHSDATRLHGGLGLGLAIVQYVVEAHGGTVRAESPGKGKGATFTVLLPLLPAGAVAVAPATPSAPRAITHARVMVVEDDLSSRESLHEALSMSGATVEAVGSAARAMEVFEQFRPHVLVCDIAMPGEDGYSLLRRIRALGRAKGGEVPALALTALASEDDRRHAMEAGFQRHLAKPVDLDAVLANVADLLPA